MKKQVQKSHYQFSKYLHKRRWASLWHQVDEVLRHGPAQVLEIGPGAGVFKAVCASLGVPVETVDIDPDLKPDHVCSVLNLPFANSSFDVACAFQMLEHIPFEESVRALGELGRVARKAVVISLPDADPAWPVQITVPRLGRKSFLIRRPFFKLRKHRFNGEHHWEVNKLGHSLEQVKSRFESISFLRLERTFRVDDFPYHRFFIFTLSNPGDARSSSSTPEPEATE